MYLHNNKSYEIPVVRDEGIYRLPFGSLPEKLRFQETVNLNLNGARFVEITSGPTPE